MSGTFEVSIDGAGALNSVLLEMQLQAQTLDRSLPVIAQMLIAAVSDVVEMQGPGWPPLAQATLDKRRKQGKDALMLRDTGVMMESLTGVYGADYVEAFFGAPYAKYHINGWGVPKRNPLNLAPVEAGLIEDVTALLLAGIA